MMKDVLGGVAQILFGVALLLFVWGGIGFVLRMMRDPDVPRLPRRVVRGAYSQAFVLLFFSLMAATGSVGLGVFKISDAQQEQKRANRRDELCEAARAAFAREPPRSLRTATIRLRMAAASVGEYSVKRGSPRPELRITIFAISDAQGEPAAVVGWGPDTGLRLC